MAPGWAAFRALKAAETATRDRDAERRHLLDLPDRFGAPHPQPDATHWYGRLGRAWLKWESHTEFVTYTAIVDGLDGRPFDAAQFEALPPDWLAQAPGLRLTSALIRIELEDRETEIKDRTDDWFVAESLAMSWILEREVVTAGDFRIDPAGHTRFAIFARPGVSEQRIGRVVQRLCEIETYKAVVMLGFAQARALAPELANLEVRLTTLVAGMARTTRSEETLHDLLEVSSAPEALIARSSYRFRATVAYETIVTQRVAALREERFEGRQTFTEFMTRRFDPATRTAASTDARLQALAERATSCGRSWMSRGRRRTRSCSKAWTGRPISRSAGSSTRWRSCRWWRSAITPSG